VNRATGWGTAAVLAAIAAFLLSQIPWRLLLLDTTIAGGDTPAHLYLASHLAKTLFGEGRIVTWADGWWCGFPMFRYYFSLPYLLMSLFSQALPFNIAFKLVTVLGVFLLPVCAWGAGRLMRLPRPTPLLLAVATVPFLFVRTHAMWGVNLSSTLAGMIANSLSFPLMVLAVASAWRDADDGEFRVRTVLLLVLTLMSHFFTSVMAGLTIAVIPFLYLRERRFWKTAGLLAGEGLLAMLMTAWWLIPLVIRRAFSMDFGSAWAVDLWKTLPPYAPWLLPLVAAALALAARRGAKAVWLFVWMGASALLLFWKGSALSPVFVNVRLWPFLYFAWLALAACGAGLLLAGRRKEWLMTAALALAALATVEMGERHEAWAVRPGVEAAAPARPCAEWNYEGLERKPEWPVFQRLMEPLRGTPGRLANELNAENTVFGSVRVFEAVPHLIGKPVLEGGLVNSAVGSMFAYYLQSESSLNAAGFPEIVKPSSFNPVHATAHFKLFNVKQFIARSPEVRQSFAALPDWRTVREENGWALFELTTHDGRYVRVPAIEPVGVLTARWKECALDWLYTFEALKQPFVFLEPGSRAAARFPGPTITEEQFHRYLDSVKSGIPLEASGLPAVFGVPTAGGRVEGEEVVDGRIRFRTTAPGQPHIVSCMYDPDWRSDAGDVFQVTPGFLLVYPSSGQVNLAFGRTGWDWLALALTLCGWGVWTGHGWRGRPRLPPAGAWRAGLLKTLDSTLGPACCRLAGWWRHMRGTDGGSAQPQGAVPPERILVIRPGGMGDMILLIPVLRRLTEAFPGVALDVVCERRNRSVLGLSGLPLEILEADAAPFHVWLTLRRRRYDVAVDTEQFHHLSALLALASGAPVRIGFKINPTRNPLYTHLIGYDMEGHEGLQFLRLLEPLGVADGAYQIEGRLKVDASLVRSEIRDEAERLASGGRLVAVHPGGTSEGKRWGGERFAQLVRTLLADERNRVVLVGGAEDRGVTEAVRRQADPGDSRLVDCAGRLSLAETAWMMSRSRVFAGGDSGVAHLAAALGVSTVVLFGPGDPRKWGLADERHRVIRRNLACSPCAVFGYQHPCRDLACLAEIKVSEVAEAVTGLLH
jgi:ADP-heptose:LPS heptosyltransferase